MSEPQGPEYYQDYEELEIDLREYIKLLWDAKWFIIGLFVLAVVAAYVFSSFVMEEEYETYATLQLDTREEISIDDEYSIPAPYARPQTASEIIKSEEIAGPIIRDLNGEIDWTDQRVRSYIESNIEVSEIEGTNMVSLTVTGKEPETIKKLADDIGEAFINKSEERYEKRFKLRQEQMARYKERLENYEEKVKEAEKEIERISEGELEPAAENLISSSISERMFNYNEMMEDAQDNYFRLERMIDEMDHAEVINSAFTPENPTSPNTTLNMAIAGVLAIMLGVFIVFFREFMKMEEEEEE